MKVACILDEFSYSCFKDEAEFIYLNKSNWLNQLISAKPEILFVESFWEGYQNDWGDELINLQLKKESEIKRLVDFCKLNDIKTIFWNKEDPVNYDLFIESAKLFEYIFTTDENCIERYKNDVNHVNIWGLSFAAQPRLHNPINVNYNEEFSVMFAGSWYPNFFIRQEEIKILLNAAMSKKLKIYDRKYDKTTKNKTIFPSSYHWNIVGSIKYKDLLYEYKNTAVHLNVNTISDSKTMFSRRIYEILACSRIPLSTYSLGIMELFSPYVKIASTEKDAKNFLDIIENDAFKRKKIGINGMHKVYNEDLYEHRWNFILSKVNKKEKSKVHKKIHIFSSIKSYYELNKVIEMFNNQLYKNKKLYIKINGFKIDKSDYESICFLDNNIINKLEIAAEDLITYFNPSDYYSKQYLNDMYYATLYSTQSLITKSSYYNQEQIVNLHLENKFVEKEDININSFIIEKKYINNLEKFLLAMLIKKNTQQLKDIKILSINSFFYIANAHKEVIHFEHCLNLNEEFNVSDYYKNINLMAKQFSVGYKGVNNLIYSKIEKEKEYYIYGAGVHTINLLNKLKETTKIKGIFDKNPSLDGSAIKGIPIYNVQLLKDNKNYKDITILISSFEYDQEIYDYIKELGFKDKQIISLYQNYKEYSEDIYKEIYSNYFEDN